MTKVFPDQQDYESDDMPSVSFTNIEAEGNWQFLQNLLIRPIKVKYHDEQLQEIVTKSIKHQDFRHQQVMIQFIQAHSEFRLHLFENSKKPPKATVLYLHGNSSCSLEVVTIISGFLKLFVHNTGSRLNLQVGLAAFDFLGCGKSAGQFITLGCRESQQIRKAVEYLQNRGRLVVLWGRSMGASSIIRYGFQNINVLDSPFSDLRTLCKQFSLNAAPQICCIVHCCFPCVFCCLNKSIQSRTGYDLGQELQLSQLAKTTQRSKSVMLMAGNKDELINHRHLMSIFDSLPCKKQMYLFQGTHNSKRPKKTIQQAYEFIHDCLLKKI